MILVYIDSISTTHPNEKQLNHRCYYPIHSIATKIADLGGIMGIKRVYEITQANFNQFPDVNVELQQLDSFCIKNKIICRGWSNQYSVDIKHNKSISINLDSIYETFIGSDNLKNQSFNNELEVNYNMGRMADPISFYWYDVKMDRQKVVPEFFSVDYAIHGYINLNPEFTDYQGWGTTSQFKDYLMQFDILIIPDDFNHHHLFKLFNAGKLDHIKQIYWK